jgi:NAD(P)-dependent dehydrogenase (short-subunit alcohol dehydrogenase family)
MSKKKWDINNIEDQSGQVAIVTGASSGIGLETARVLSIKGAQVIIAVRNAEKGRLAVTEIQSETSKALVSFMLLDLADLKSISEFSQAFKKEHQQLDLLINNAGVMVPPFQKTVDGFELQMGTNHLGHFALTGHLLELIMRTPYARIINVSSLAHSMGNINFEDLNWEKRKYKKWKAYGDSKIANLYFTAILKQKLKGINSNVLTASAHPGWTATELQRNSGLANILNPLFAQTMSMGALPTLFAATAPDVSSGDYFGPGGFKEIKGYPKKAKSNVMSQNLSNATKLWECSETLTKVRFKFED